MLRGCPRHLIEDFNEEALTSTTDIYKSINKLKKIQKTTRSEAPPLSARILRDGVFKGLPPDAQCVRFEAR